MRWATPAFMRSAGMVHMEPFTSFQRAFLTSPERVAVRIKNSNPSLVLRPADDLETVSIKPETSL